MGCNVWDLSRSGGFPAPIWLVPSPTNPESGLSETLADLVLLGQLKAANSACRQQQYPKPPAGSKHTGMAEPLQPCKGPKDKQVSQ